MRIFIVVNGLAELEPDQTTVLLALTAAAVGHEVLLAGVIDLALAPDGRVVIRARSLREGPADGTVRVCDRLADAVEQRVLGAGDVLWIRTNPARDRSAWAHGVLLNLARIAQDGGVHLFNDPLGLARGASKLYLHRLDPRWTPRTLVDRDPQSLRAFVQNEPGGKAVIKPLSGTRGRDVFLVRADDPNFAAMVDVIAREGMVIAQEYVPEAVAGDVRVMLVDGAIFEVGGVPLAVRRVPPAGGFRSNVHQGGHAIRAEVTDGQRACVEQVGHILREDGLFLVGADFIGDKIVELNVFSPGGFLDAERFYDRPFLRGCVEALVAKATSADVARA